MIATVGAKSLENQISAVYAVVQRELEILTRFVVIVVRKLNTFAISTNFVVIFLLVIITGSCFSFSRQFYYGMRTTLSADDTILFFATAVFFNQGRIS